MKNFKDAKRISHREQQKILGGKKIEPDGCNCFCYDSSGNQYNASCFQWCSDGTVPGYMPGNGPECKGDFTKEPSFEK